MHVCVKGCTRTREGVYRETDDTSIYVINLVIAELASSSAAVGAVSRVYYSKEKKTNDRHPLVLQNKC